MLDPHPRRSMARRLLPCVAMFLGATGLCSSAQALRAQDPQAGNDLLGPGRGLEITLEAAQEIALRQNFGLQIEALSTEAAFDNARSGWGGFDWLFHVGGGVTDRKGPQQNLFGGENSNTEQGTVDFTKPLTTGGSFKAAFDTVNTRTNSTISTVNPSTRDLVSLTYTQPLLRGGWSEYATANQRANELAWRQQEEHERTTRQKLLVDVCNAYWDLVAAREQLEVRTGGVRLAQTQMDEDKKRLDAGIGTRLDLLQAETQLALREQEHLQADLRLRQAADALKQLLFPGKDPERWETTLIPATSLPEIVAVPAGSSVSWTAPLAKALDRRAELLEQRWAIDGAKLRREQREHERLSQLDLVLGASGEGFGGKSQDAFSDSTAYKNPTLSATINLTLPIGNNTARFASKAAWAQERQARLAYDQLESKIAAEVREAVRQIAYQAEAVRAARKSIELATEQLKAEQVRREVGNGTNFNLLKFQQDLLAAYTSERQARADFAKAEIGLQAAQGTLGEKDTP